MVWEPLGKLESEDTKWDKDGGWTFQPLLSGLLPCRPSRGGPQVCHPLRLGHWFVGHCPHPGSLHSFLEIPRVQGGKTQGLRRLHPQELLLP